MAVAGIGLGAIQPLYSKPGTAGRHDVQVAVRSLGRSGSVEIAGSGLHRQYAGGGAFALHGNGTVGRQFGAKPIRRYVGQVVGQNRLAIRRRIGARHRSVDKAVHGAAFLVNGFSAS